MKNVFRVLGTCFLFLCCMFALPAFAADQDAPVATTETITMSKGDTLWALFKAQQLPNKDWPKYWEEASLLSGIPHTDAAWRKLPIGSVITVPRDPRAIQADERLRVITGELSAIAIEIAALKQSIAETKKKEAERRATFERVLMGISILIALIGSYGLIYLLRNAKKQQQRAKNIEAINALTPETVKGCCEPSLHVAPCCALPCDTSPPDMFSDSKPVPPRWHPT